MSLFFGLDQGQKRDSQLSLFFRIETVIITVTLVTSMISVTLLTLVTLVTLTSLAMIVHLLKLALLVKTMTLVASWTSVTLGTLVRLPSLVIKRDEQLKRNYFGSIDILLVHTVTFVGRWGCGQRFVLESSTKISPES